MHACSGREIAAAAPHHLHTVHNATSSPARGFHPRRRLARREPGYTYGVAYLHILPEYQRTNPVRP